MAKAVRPDFYSSFPTLQREDTKKEATDDEQMLYGMSKTNGWKLFSEYAETLVKELDQLNDSAVANGATYEELGKNTIVISLTKGIINKLLNKVSDSKEACERPSAKQ